MNCTSAMEPVDSPLYALLVSDRARLRDHNKWQDLYRQLQEISPEVLDDLLVLFDLSCSHQIKQSQNDKATLLINKARERGWDGWRELDRYLTLDPQHTQADVLRRRISQDLRHLAFDRQGESFELRMRNSQNRGAFIIHGTPLKRTNSHCTAHRWLTRQLLFLMSHPQRLDEHIIPLSVEPISRDSRDENIRIQLARALGSRRRGWPDLVAKASARESSIFIVEPVEELAAGELDDFLWQFWEPLNRSLDQLDKIRGPVLLFLLSYEHDTSSSAVQSPSGTDGTVDPTGDIVGSSVGRPRGVLRTDSANDPQQLDRIEPLSLGMINGWISRMRRDWGDGPEFSARLREELEATDIIPHNILEQYVDMRLDHLSEDQWSRAKKQLETEWFLLNLPKWESR